jgi:phospholipid/cholesterol/gamma-HCH transport system substrate-binding protein
MSRSPVRDFVVGLFVLAGIGAIVYLSVSIGGFTWQNNENLKLSASFNEIGDLAVRAPVQIAGVRVGEITGITLEKNFRARVEMRLDSDLKLPVDTSAAIVTAGLLGDRYIELQPGGEDQMLKSGEAIAFTDSAVILEHLIGQLVYGVTKDSDSGKAPATTSKAP